MGEVYFWAYMISGIPPIFIAKWRLSTSIQICSLLVVVGSTVKYFSYHNFWWALTGQIIIGLSQGFLYCTPGAFAFRWFPEKTIPLVMTVFLYGSSTGAGIGFLIPPFMETPVETSQLIMVIYSGLVFVLLLIFGFKEYPDSPPSAFAGDQDIKLGFMDSMRAVGRHKSLLKTAGVLFIGLGCTWGFLGVNSMFIIRSGLNDRQAGIYGMAVTLGG
jgi:hypothetical protein